MTCTLWRKLCLNWLLKLNNLGHFISLSCVLPWGDWSWRIAHNLIAAGPQRDRSETAYVWSRRCYPHTGSSGLKWCLSSNNMIFHPGFYRIRVSRGWLPCGRYLLTPLTENKEGNMGLMALWVRPKPTRFPTNILHIPLDNTPAGCFGEMQA